MDHWRCSISTAILELDNPIGVLIFIIMLIILNYYLSRVMLNTKRIARLSKEGNYFDGIYPGDDTRHYLDRRAKKLVQSVP